MTIDRAIQTHPEKQTVPGMSQIVELVNQIKGRSIKISTYSVDGEGMAHEIYDGLPGSINLVGNDEDNILVELVTTNDKLPWVFNDKTGISILRDSNGELKSVVFDADPGKKPDAGRTMMKLLKIDLE